MADAPPLSRLIAAGANRAVGRAVGGLIIPSKARPSRLPDAAKASSDYGKTAEPSWLEVDWSSHIHDMQVFGRRVRYVDYGPRDGKPIVLIHGISSNWQNWLEQLPRLGAEGYRALALDLPGFGFSQMPREQISISGFADTVDEWCGQLGLEAVPVVGHSMGGFTGAELAIRHPERVERLALIAAAGITHANLRSAKFAGGGRIYTAITARELIQVDALLQRPAARYAILSVIFRYPTLIRPELVFEIARGRGTPGFTDALKAIVGYDFRDRLPEVACPTFILWGSDDMLAPVEDADVYERLIPNTRKVVLEDTGHMINSERPETFNRCLLEFLAEDPGERAGSENGAAASRKKPAGSGSPPKAAPEPSPSR